MTMAQLPALRHRLPLTSPKTRGTIGRAALVSPFVFEYAANCAYLGTSQRRQAKKEQRMIIPVALILGAIFGWFRAHQRGLATLDKLQYAAVHGILLTLLAVFGLMILDNFVLT